jgi:hypothetical protein
MKKEELPDWVRVKLPEKQTEELWENIESISEFAEESRYSAQQLYNWKNKDAFLPIDLVRKVLESFEVKAMKGRNNSKPVKNPDFPLGFSDELLTRVDTSVSVNREGTPVYSTQEASLFERFGELLDQIGDVPYSVYRRSGYELRYPKFLHDLMMLENYEGDFAALFDEKGRFEGDEMVADDIFIEVGSFEGELWHMEKRYRLALITGNVQELKAVLKSRGLKASALDHNF